MATLERYCFTSSSMLETYSSALSFDILISCCAALHCSPSTVRAMLESMWWWHVLKPGTHVRWHPDIAQTSIEVRFYIVDSVYTNANNALISPHTK